MFQVVVINNQLLTVFVRHKIVINHVAELGNLFMMVYGVDGKLHMKKMLIKHIMLAELN